MASGLAHYVDFLIDTDGEPIAGGSVEIRDQGTATAIDETIYAEDDDTGATLSNPLTSAADGKIEFYLVVPARVDLRITASGFSPITVTVDVMHIEPSTLTVLNNGASTAGYQTLDFIGGDVTVDNPNQKLVITAPSHDGGAVHTADQPPTTHASDHATGGGDAITAASIDAASETHSSAHASAGSDPIAPSDIGAADAAHTHDPGGETFVMPSGSLVPYGGSSAPTGWLLCDGSAVSRTTYSDLFTAIGTTFGTGDGSTTFNLPDLRGRFPMGKDASGTGSTLGATGGSKDHTHTSASHSHGATGSSGSGGTHTHNDHDFASNTAVQGQNVRLTTTNHSFGGDHTHFISVGIFSASPGATGSNNPPFVALNYIIKT